MLAFNNVSGRVFYPIVKGKQKKFSNINFIDEIQCLSKIERIFYRYRNEHMMNEVEKKYNILEFDNILAHSLFSNGLLAMSISNSYKIPYNVIVTNTDMNLYFKKAFWLRRTGVEILKNANKVIFTSSAYKEELIEKYLGSDSLKKEIGSKSVCIPFGIDRFWIENRKRKDKSSVDNEVNILYVGKINSNKNILLTLNACKKMIQEGKKVKFTVVGDIENKRDKKILDKILKEDFVVYYKKVSFNKLIDYYRNNDIFVMPSIAESFGLVYAEAMTQGLPVVYTKGQGFDKQFPDRMVGVAVDSSSEKGIIDSIEYIMNNYYTMSENAYEKSKNFSWSLIAGRFINTLEE